MEQSTNKIIFVALLLIFCLTNFSRASDNKDNKLKDVLRNKTNSKTKNSNNNEQNDDSNENDNILKTESQKMLRQCGVERNESSSSNTDYNRYNSDNNNGNYNNNNYRNGNSNRNSYNNKYEQNQGTKENQNGFYGNSRNNNNTNNANRNNYNNYGRYNKGEDDNEGSNSNNNYEERNSYSSQYGNENQNDGGNNNSNNGFTNKGQQSNYYGQTNSENNGYGSSNFGDYDNQNNQYGIRNRNSRPNGSNLGQNNQGSNNEQQGYGGYGFRFPNRGYQGSSTNNNDVRSSNGPNRGYSPGAGPSDDCDDRGDNRNIFGYNTGMTMGLNKPHSRHRRFNLFNREENDNDENTQCVSQCVFGYLHLLDDDRTPSETMLIKWLQEHVTGDDMERIKSLRDARRCFARLTTGAGDIEDGCEFSKELSKCLELDLE